MTSTTREILDRFQVRKSRKTKSAFIDWLRPVVDNAGFTMTTEKCSFGGRNIVIGDPDAAKVVFTAHYDTCAWMPFPNFITPRNFLIYLLYQLVLTVFLLIIPGVIAYASSFLVGDACVFVFLATLYGMLALMMMGPANRHTVNDNTSGVTVIIDMICTIPPELRDKVAFVLFDYEEQGLIGSSSFASKHKKAFKNKPVINFDCVSDGENVIFAVKKKANSFVPLLEQVYTPHPEVDIHIFTKGVFYPSDQASFPCGIGVAALNKSRFLNVLYMDKIHTHKDTVYRQENMNYLVQKSIDLIGLIG